MDYKRIALLLEDQLKLAAQREEELLKVIADQNEQLNILTAEVKSLNSSILSLEKALLEKNASLEGQQSKVRILGKMVSGKKSEQVSVPDKGTTIIAKVKPSLKERGNNGARRKEYLIWKPAIMISIRMQQSSKWKKAKNTYDRLHPLRIYSSPFYQAYLSPALLCL